MNASKHHPDRQRITFILSVVTIAAITILIYWSALRGPFVLDDAANLTPIFGWLHNQNTWQYAISSNHSGPLHRPISMATFLLDAALSHSTASFSFKLTNLGIHLACGLAILWLATQIFRHWAPTRRIAPWAALILMAWWLWLPLNVDTVLYTVQRMAQLAALFMLLALGCYLTARERIAQGRPSGQLLLWIGVPALTVLAVFSKENGVLALPLALVLEGLLCAREGERRPRSIKWFFALTVGIPILAGVAGVLWRPSFITGGYAYRPFTLIERLLTEPRVLWSYVQTLLVPIGLHMGFFQDNFPVSTSLWHPWTTLPAILAWLACVVVGWRWRKGNPLFGAGVFFFLVGQSIESSVIPLEIYFEHRNYLPSFGILLAVVGTLVWAWQRLPTPTTMFRRMAAVLVACVLGLFCVATWGHVQSWRTARSFYTAQEVFNPASPRLQSELTTAALRAGNLKGALRHIAIAEANKPAMEYPTSTLWRFLSYCSLKKTPPAALYRQLDHRAHGRIAASTMKAFEQLAEDVHLGCPDIDVVHIKTIMQHWLATTPTPSHSVNVWRTRYDLGRMIAYRGHLAEARDVEHRAWVDSRYNNGVGVLLFQLNASLGNAEACRDILARLEPAYGHGDARLDQAIRTFRQALADGKIQPRREGAPTRIATDGTRQAALTSHHP